MALTSAVSRLAREIASGQTPDLSVSEMSVLANLEARPGSSPADLAAAEGIRPPSITRKVKALRARGLIEPEPHPGDRRRTRLTVTDKGREVLSAARKVAWLTVRVAELPEKHRTVLRAAIPLLDELNR